MRRAGVSSGSRVLRRSERGMFLAGVPSILSLLPTQEACLINAVKTFSFLSVATISLNIHTLYKTVR